MRISSAASLPFTASLDHTLSMTVPSARPISGISTAYATWLSGIDTIVSQHSRRPCESWRESCVKSIKVGHCEVDVAHGSQDWHDARLLTCRRRLTDHYAELQTPIAARLQKLGRCEVAGRVRIAVSQWSRADSCALMWCVRLMQTAGGSGKSRGKQKLHLTEVSPSTSLECTSPPHIAS